MEPECKRYGDPVESIEHALRDCSGLAGVWNALPYGPVAIMDPLSIEEWALGLVKWLEKDEWPCFACVLWAIWYARNALIFQN